MQAEPSNAVVSVVSDKVLQNRKNRCGLSSLCFGPVLVLLCFTHGRKSFRCVELLICNIIITIIIPSSYSIDPIGEVTFGYIQQVDR
jgi:hypothetical protein